MAYSLELGRSKSIMIGILEDNFEGVYMSKSGMNPILGSTVNIDTILDASTDGRNNSVKELVISPIATNGVEFVSNIYQNDDEKKILTFYLTRGESADKLVYFKEVGSNQYKITGVQTFQSIQSDFDKPVFISSLRINLIDGQ